MNSLKESYVRGMKADKKMGGKMGEMKLERLTIKEADNGGFVVSCNYKAMPKEGGKNNGEMPMCGSMYDEKELVAKDFDGLVEILEDMFGD